MSNLVKDVTSFSRKVTKIEGPLGENMILASGEGAIAIGQVLSYDESTGKVVKYNSGSNTAFSIALSEADSTSGDVPVLVARPITRFNIAEVKGITLSTDFKGRKELWSNGILLEEVK